ncbi:MAG: class I SAM-dependent methyltransferase [Gammaproteobacteria bacterium]|nr:class I SAM-dependent methyltransferase [Gammaproteobacteria bacterium]
MIISKRGYSGYRPDIVAAISHPNISSVLDVGCGEGGIGAQLKEKTPAIEVYGIEADPVLLAQAEKMLDGCWAADLDAPEWASPIKDKSFDVIIFADVLEHLKSPSKVLADALPLLNKNGQIVICLPNVRHWSTFYHLYIKGVWPTNDRGIFDKTHLHFFTRRNILDLIREAGLEVVLEKRNVRIIEPWSWTNLPGKILDWWPFRPFFTFQYIHVCKFSSNDSVDLNENK